MENNKQRHFPATTAWPCTFSGNDSAKRVASLALAATKSNIERTVAPPTLEQARVMGVESVVEGVDWKLSTDQLQVDKRTKDSSLGGFAISTFARVRLPPLQLTAGARLVVLAWF